VSAPNEALLRRLTALCPSLTVLSCTVLLCVLYRAQADIVVLLKMTPCMLRFSNPRIEHYSDALLPFAPLRSRAQRAIRRLGRPYVALHFRSEFILWHMVSWQMVSWQVVSWQVVSWQVVSWPVVSWQMVSWQVVSWQMVSWQVVSWQIRVV